MCRVCEIVHEGNHLCQLCHHRTHPWHGISSEEGYAKELICSVCYKDVQKPLDNNSNTENEIDKESEVQNNEVLNLLNDYKGQQADNNGKDNKKKLLKNEFLSMPLNIKRILLFCYSKYL